MIDPIDFYDNMRMRNEKIALDEKVNISTWQHIRSRDLGYKKPNVICCGEAVDERCKTCGSMIYERLVCDWRPPHTPYKRPTYFKECITKIQAKQTLDISDDVMLRIKNEISKSDEVHTVESFRYLLKKLQLNHLYSDAAGIMSYIFNDIHPDFSVPTENIFHSYFHKICIIWNEVKPISRKTMLPYKYLFRKIGEIENLNYQAFPLPTNINKTIEYDVTWKKICLKNNWNFISSFGIKDV